ncbi:MAG: lipopolysaccharide heptosyltransferase I, partial [Burkholderiales bacterium]
MRTHQGGLGTADWNRESGRKSAFDSPPYPVRILVVQLSASHGVQRILLVKTSSMGDVIHNLPVVSDLAVQFPRAQIDWVVEEAFTALPRLHGMVREIHAVAFRRWRRAPLSRATWREIGAFRHRIAAQAYDAIIDTQGLIKSALLVACARGRKYGLDWASSREPIGWFYHRTFAIPRDRHAVERNRALAAQALGYTLSGPASYAIQVPVSAQDELNKRAGRVLEQAGQKGYAALLHSTSSREKEWPEDFWAALGQSLHRRGILSLLPFGDPRERARSERLANRIPGALVPPALPLDTFAAMLADAAIVVGVDTGLSHLAAALGRPTVGIYCATDPRFTGLYGGPRAVNLGGPAGAPSVDEVIAA